MFVILLMPISAFSQIQNRYAEANTHSDSTNEVNKNSFKRFQVYAGAGVPYGICIGGKYRLSQAFFIELETPALIGIKDGYSYLSVGVSTTNYSDNSSFVYVDGEVSILFGNFPAVWLFSGSKPGIGGGLSLRGEIGTSFGLSLYLKLGGAALFNGYGARIFQVGLSINI